MLFCHRHGWRVPVGVGHLRPPLVPSNLMSCALLSPVSLFAIWDLPIPVSSLLFCPHQGFPQIPKGGGFRQGYHICLCIKPTFSLSSFTFIKRLFSFSSLSAIEVVSSAPSGPRAGRVGDAGPSGDIGGRVPSRGGPAAPYPGSQCPLSQPCRKKSSPEWT